VGKLVDGLMSEGTSGISETHKYLCVRKPLLVHTYPTDVFKTESMFRYVLLSGASYSYGGSSTLRQTPVQSQEVQTLFAEYKFLADSLLGAEIILSANPFKLPPMCKGEIFQSRKTSEKFISLLPETSSRELEVTVNVAHGKTAWFCSNKNHSWLEIEFKENILHIPNDAKAYLIKF
jgi:hypothetical protein